MVAADSSSWPAPPGAAIPPGRLWKHILVTAGGTGALAGILEVCWSYLLPWWDPGWRSVLPTSAGALLSFFCVAVLTDGLLMLSGGVGLAIAIAVVRRWSSPARRWRHWPLVIRGGLFWAAWGSLYVCWMGLFVLPSEDRRTLSYRLMMVVGVAVLLISSFAAAAVLGWAERRLHRAAAKGCWCAALLVVVAATIPAFNRYAASQRTTLEIPVGGGGPRPNVLLVTLDTLRYDYVGGYGNSVVKTPALDTLAADATQFETAISQAPSTGPSHCSIMTSVYPGEHDAFNGKPMKKGFVTIADVLQANGYETAAFTSSTTTRSVTSGLHQGFDHYVDSLVPWSEAFSRDDLQQLVFFYVFGVAENSEIRGEVVTRRFIRWLDQRTDKPFFVWLHYFDPHGPYAAPQPYGSMYRGQFKDSLPMARHREAYAGEVTYVDHQLGCVIDELKKRKLYDQMLIMVTSDHGEAFGEKHWNHTEVAHGKYLYDTTQRVPLIIRAAGGRGRGLHIAEQVELNDLAPTILSFLGIDPPRGFKGKPLNELIEGRPYSYPNRPAYAANDLSTSDLSRPGSGSIYVQQKAVRTPECKYITIPYLGQDELYDLRNDPGEVKNLAAQSRPVCKAKRLEVAAVLGTQQDVRADPRPRIAPALRRQLEGLGYLGGGGAEPMDRKPAQRP